MQTFLPYASFSDSAAVLDRQRLGKQRVEAWQILQTLRGRSTGFDRHPAVRMWAGYELALCRYGIVMCHEWTSRGYLDGMAERFLQAVVELLGDASVVDPPNPPWVGDPRFHSAHRSALLFKNFDHYSRFHWTEQPFVEYYWPVSRTGGPQAPKEAV